MCYVNVSFLFNDFRLIATPGRLLHIAVEMNLKLSTIRYVVFDEADRLFEMGFAQQLHVCFIPAGWF